MKKHLIANLWLLGLTLTICVALYPLALLGIGQLVMPVSVNGSLVTDASGTVVGSRLIAQPFSSTKYFHPRPSAVAYNAAATGGSNWGASNPNLRQRVVDQLQLLAAGNSGPVPSDLVLASGSGVDPHITLQGARFQLDRVSAAWSAELGRDPAQVRAEIEQVLDAHAESPLAGLAGPELINVLETNLALAAHFEG